MLKGEKLYEEMLIRGNPETTVHEKIFIGDRADGKMHQFELLYSKLLTAINGGDINLIMDNIALLVPEFVDTSYSK